MWIQITSAENILKIFVKIFEFWNFFYTCSVHFRKMGYCKCTEANRKNFLNSKILTKIFKIFLENESARRGFPKTKSEIRTMKHARIRRKVVLCSKTFMIFYYKFSLLGNLWLFEHYSKLPPHGLSATVLKSDRRQGCLLHPGGIFWGGVAPVLKLDRRQGSVTNEKTSVRGGGGSLLYLLFTQNCFFLLKFYNK